MNHELNRQAQIDDKLMAPSVAEQLRGIVRSAAQHAMFPRICLSCGASETLDGSVPCGH
nr:MAG TPA: hypothetical protein [Caudoviricetes sp.]